jgi:benzoyl-CoA reductase/2-hydroxyglutaryl-CoA dehydratase subunit BcrC/BadD/HgdB
MTAPESKGIARFRKDRDQYRDVYELFQSSDDPELQHAGLLGKLISEARDRVIRAHEAGEPFIASHYLTAPEVAVAMDLPWYALYEGVLLGASGETLHQDLDATAALGLGQDLCAVHRWSIYYVENDLVPIPTAAIGLVYPCDGIAMLHQLIRSHENWRDVPFFTPDPPYFEDDRAVEYFARELRKMAAFLEEVTGRELDPDRLKAVVEESEKQYRLWADYGELRRAVPCPHGFAQGGLYCTGVAQVMRPGHSEGTEWFQKLVANAERRVANGVGAVPQERIRLFWFDIMPIGWIQEFMPWLEQEWGAVVVMDMFGNHAYTPIDTSSEEGIWTGLARRALFEGPMARGAIGTAQARVDDLVRIVKDYQIDAVVWPSHVGHKETLGLQGILRKTCRELEVPFLDLRMDIFDKRYTTPDELKGRFSEFFQSVDLG